MTTRALALLLTSCFVLFGASGARACELCDGPGSNFVALQEHVARWPLVALGEPVGRTREGRVQFKVTRILKGDKNLQLGSKVAPRGASAVLPGHVWLLLGRKANFQAGTVLMLRPATLEFLRAAPRLPPDSKPAERLRALVPWLRNRDPMVSASARKEFAAAPYEVLAAAAESVRADDLVRTLADPNASPGSRGPLFLLLGLAGGPAERKLLATWMRDPKVQRAPGYDALLASWLTMTGAAGLEPTHALLRAEHVELSIVGGALVRALGFHARNTKRLGRAYILASLNKLLAEVAFFGVTLEQMERLEAWGELKPVLAAYEQHKQDAPWTLGPVLRYLEAHPAPEAKKERERLQAAQFQRPKQPPTPGK